MKQKTVKTKIGLLLTEKTDDQYFHVTLRPVTIGPTAEDRSWHERCPTSTLPTADAIRNSRSEDGPLDLADLLINSQGNNDDQPRRLYGFEARYQQVFCVDLTKVQRMAKTLTAIDRHLTKVAAKYGHPENFGAFVARVAEAIGADSIVIATSNRGWSYAENDHRFLGIESGIYAINEIVRKWTTPEVAA